jgi:hypothetical protein
LRRVRFAPIVCGVGRLRLVAAWGLLVTVAAGGWLLLRPARDPGTPAAVPAAHRLPAVRRDAGRWDRWTITEQFAAQHVMVLQIETTHLDESAAIARAVATPLQDRYSEIMIYFHRPGRPDTLPPRRVQWSRAAGFVETDFEQR